MPELTPLPDVMVSDRYWLGLGRKILDAGITRRDDAAGKLVTAIAWFWTAYAAASLVASSLTDRDFSGFQTFLIVLPAGLLILAYVAATWALMPVDLQFDPRMPDAIREAHLTAMREKRNRLRWAAGITFLAAASVVVAIATTAAASSRPETEFHAHTGSGNAILVAGRFPDNAEVVVKVQAVDKAGDLGPATEQLILASADGALAATITPTVEAPQYRVSAAWSANERDLSISLMVQAGE